MSFQSQLVAATARTSIRFGIMLAIPVVIAMFVVYAAAKDEENLHDRNLRWLAQIAVQIHERVENYTGLVRRRAMNPASAARSSQSKEYTSDNLKAAEGNCNPSTWKHLSVVDTAAELQLRFMIVNDGRNVCAYTDLRKLVEPAIRKNAFTTVLLADRSGKVLCQTESEGLRITNSDSCSPIRAAQPNPAKRAALPRKQPHRPSRPVPACIGKLRLVMPNSTSSFSP